MKMRSMLLALIAFYSLELKAVTVSLDTDLLGRLYEKVMAVGGGHVIDVAVSACGFSKTVVPTAQIITGSTLALTGFVHRQGCSLTDAAGQHEADSAMRVGQGVVWEGIKQVLRKNSGNEPTIEAKLVSAAIGKSIQGVEEVIKQRTSWNDHQTKLVVSFSTIILAYMAESSIKQLSNDQQVIVQSVKQDVLYDSYLDFLCALWYNIRTRY